MRIENSFILIPGFGQKLEQRLWENNVTHWDHLPEDNVLSENKRSSAIEFVQKARKNLEVGNTLFFENQFPSKELWRIYQNFKKDACFFDIETTGLSKERNKVTTVSFYRNGEDKTLVRGDNLTKEALQEEVFNSSMFVSFNGKRFDQPFLEHNFDLTMNKPHVDLMYVCRQLGLSGGLKPIEKELGIARDDVEDVDGREAVRLWKKYEKKGDQQALDKLVEYNQYDARNLKTLFDLVHGRLRDQRFGQYM
jgi:hypothetical protein